MTYADQSLVHDPSCNQSHIWILAPELYTFGPLAKKMLKTPQIRDVLGLKFIRNSKEQQILKPQQDKSPVLNYKKLFRSRHQPAER